MIILWIVAVGLPLLELPPAPDLRFEKSAPKVCDVITELFVISQHIGGFDRVGEEIVDDHLVVGDAFFRRTMFWRPPVGRHQSSIRAPLQMVVPELAGFLEHGIRGLAEVALVASEREVLP